ncbi:patatin-like phospholipase family protein [Lichenihabitans psoromatis]|uniref:patatin-like phospholipase family protein n=1 Tax=Lichenihabitans psoromatis TaxID=2528642 RepID=UPI0013F176C9|nr:patatin-like phospholipase family protein [Lichenihabitans psoromatis]
MIVRRGSVLGIIIASSVALAGCTSTEFARIPYTASEAAMAEIPGMSNVRFYGDTSASVFDSFTTSTKGVAVKTGPVNYLALSGGGADGAFGAGLLHGLTETNRRPDFTIVSGVSTGALMAPFVFLGPSYDDTLRDLYTGDLGAGLIKNVNLLNGVFGNALVENDKLGRLVSKYVDQTIMDRVAEEHRKGRRLFVATTNLDSQRSVVWDMGAIATSGSPNALSLFRQVLTASASIPGLFPPRLVSVEAGGREFKEMHVDGGTIQQVFVAPDAVLFGEQKDRPFPQLKNLYVLLNNKVDPVFQVVDNNVLKLGTRSLSTILKREVHNNVQAAYAYARRHNVGFHMASIEADVSEEGSNTFDQAYMKSLYAYGIEQGKGANPWTDAPTMSVRPLASNRKLTAQK